MCRRANRETPVADVVLRSPIRHGLGRFGAAFRSRGQVQLGVALENVFQLGAGVFRQGDERGPVVKHGLLTVEHSQVVGGEQRDHAVGIDLGLHGLQCPPSQLHAGAPGFAQHVFHAKLAQAHEMGAVARPRQQRHVGEVGAQQLGDLQAGLDVIDGEDEQPGVLHMGGAQQRQAGGVAVVDLVAELAHEIHLFGAGVQRGERHALRVEQPSDDLADAPVARDDDGLAGFVDSAEGRRLTAARPRLDQPVVEDE